MAHMMKHTKASCGHMFAHFDRKAAHISNENLDRTRTHLNYNLATHQQMDQGEFIRQRCSEVRCQNRKDVNVMVSWVITAPKDLPEQEYKAFFKASYDFLEQRYGSVNVVSSYVHMDEVTPHMHFAFVPVIFDNKREKHKVSAKEVVNRKDLQTFHADLQGFLEHQLGHEVGVLNEATKNGNRSISELKRSEALNQLENAKKDIQAIKTRLEPLKAEYEAKLDVIEHSQELLPSQFHAKTKKMLGKETVTLPKNEYDQLINQACNAISLAHLAEKAEEKFKEWRISANFKTQDEWKDRIESLEGRNLKLYLENKNLHSENRKLRTDNTMLRKRNKEMEERLRVSRTKARRKESDLGF